MLSETTTNELNLLFECELSETVRRKHSKKWQCSVSEVCIGEYLIIPLTSVKMLNAESYTMNNCCREYAAECAEGNYSIFSIRSRAGERLATLRAENDDGYWRFDQCYGYSNEEVLEEVFEYFDDDGVLQTEWSATELYYVAHDVVRLLNNSGTRH